MRDSPHGFFSKPGSLRAEMADFARFVFHPTLKGRLPGRRTGSVGTADLWPGTPGGRVLFWAFMLWLINFFIFGPLALYAADTSGAVSRFNPEHLPIILGIFWAPITEELCFRGVLRRPQQLWWMVPSALAVIVIGPRWWTGLALCGLYFLFLFPRKWGGLFPRGVRAWVWRRRYIRTFPYWFHLVSLCFAMAHWVNFTHKSLQELWLLPLLVVPQWLTGLVLGWMRVKRGMGASMFLHGVFNAGPLLMAWGLVNLLHAAVS